MHRPNLSLERKVFRGVSWLAFFKAISQTVSWVTTIFVARILLPNDYGLFAMTTILTGYLEIFSNLGLGIAIIQKKDLNENELSSVFWFTLSFTMLLAISCFPISYLTSSLMHEPRVVPLVQVIAVTFLFAGLQIVPQSLLTKELDFKSLGMIDMIVIVASCLGMIVMALQGMGVWALIGGILIRSLLRVILLYYKVRWFPTFRFNFYEAKSYITFGLTMTFSRSARYIWIASDKFFAGRAWHTNILGYYSLALQLAQIPTEKIVTLINQVAYPAFTKLQDDKKAFNVFYLNILKITASLILPLFFGGFLIGEDLVKMVLNEKWYPIIYVFRYLCLSQIFMALTAVNTFAHAAQGRPDYGLKFNIACMIIMPISFYFAAKYGLNAIIIPWILSFAILCIIWILFTIYIMGINITEYFSAIKSPIIAISLMTIAVASFRYHATTIGFINNNVVYKFILSTIIGGSIYIGYFLIFDRELIIKLKNLRNSQI